MDEQCSWKKTDETEIDLADLLRGFCRQWKRAAACALLSAALLGGYGQIKGAGSTDMPVMPEDAELTEDERQAVEDAVRLEKDNRELEAYLENSLLMQADPYHKAVQAMLYCIDRADRQDIAAVTESYLNYAANGGAAEALGQSSGRRETDRSCLAELVTAYQKTYTYPYQAVMDSGAGSSLTAESLFYVEITGRNAEEAREMARDMQDVLENYAAEVRKNAGGHRLRLVSSVESITADSELKARQREKISQLSSGRANLKTVTDAFSREQTAVYREALGKQDAGEAADEEDSYAEETAASGMHAVIKHGLLGLLLGISAYGCVYACRYVFSGTVKNAGELKRRYAFPVYGQIQPDGAGEKNGRLQQDAFGNTAEKAADRIRLACRKKGVKKLCAASDFPLAASERECLEKMAARLARCGTDMPVAESISTDTAAWDSLARAGNVLLVCRTGMSTYRSIDDAMDFYAENGIAVAGAVVFSGKSG